MNRSSRRKSNVKDRDETTLLIKELCSNDDFLQEPFSDEKSSNKEDDGLLRLQNVFNLRRTNSYGYGKLDENPILDKIFDMKTQLQDLCNEDKAFIDNIQNDIQFINECNDLLQKVIDSEFNSTEIKLRKLQTDFEKHRNLLDDVLRELYPDKSKQISSFLKKLLEKYFEDDTKFLEASNRQISEEDIKMLLATGIIETKNDDLTHFKLADIMG